jgi:peptide chain release factor 2
MVKDLRTDHETGNTQAVLDGELDPFVHAYLMWRASNGAEKA